MPEYVSRAGILMPKKEVAQVPLTVEEMLAGKNGVYQGEDRGAINQMIEQGYMTPDPDGKYEYTGEDSTFQKHSNTNGNKYTLVSYPGNDCFEEEDMLVKARSLGYATVEEYLEKRRKITRQSLEASADKKLESIGVKIGEDRKDRRPDINTTHDKAGPGQFKQGGFAGGGKGKEDRDVQSAALKAAGA